MSPSFSPPPLVALDYTTFSILRIAAKRPWALELRISLCYNGLALISNVYPEWHNRPIQRQAARFACGPISCMGALGATCQEFEGMMLQHQDPTGTGAWLAVTKVMEIGLKIGMRDASPKEIVSVSKTVLEDAGR